jgi:hypothetical protein
MKNEKFRMAMLAELPSHEPIRSSKPKTWVMPKKQQERYQRHLQQDFYDKLAKENLS